MKATTAQIKETLANLEANVSAARKSGNRNLVRETVLRIRQLRGILEVRA